MTFPSTIKSKEDWIETAKYVAHMLPGYMSQISGNVDEASVDAELSMLVAEEDWEELHNKFEQIWAWLPDRPDIHRHPFSRLCDLCSEYWVFEET
jgi:hypothetical protein